MWDWWCATTTKILPHIFKPFHRLNELGNHIFIEGFPQVIFTKFYACWLELSIYQLEQTRVSDN